MLSQNVTESNPEMLFAYLLLMKLIGIFIANEAKRNYLIS